LRRLRVAGEVEMLRTLFGALYMLSFRRIAT
jgi:hypothetical protein